MIPSLIPSLSWCYLSPPLSNIRNRNDTHFLPHFQSSFSFHPFNFPLSLSHCLSQNTFADNPLCLMMGKPMRILLFPSWIWWLNPHHELSWFIFWKDHQLENQKRGDKNRNFQKQLTHEKLWVSDFRNQKNSTFQLVASFSFSFDFDSGLLLHHRFPDFDIFLVDRKSNVFTWLH